MSSSRRSCTADGGIRIARANAEDWQTVRDTRLTALADAPTAFGSTLERDSAIEDAEWKRRAIAGNWFLAWSGAQPIGIAAGVIEAGEQDEHHLTAMWVTRSHRGTPVATELVDAVSSWAQMHGARQLTLWVADDNARARRFYERLGFLSTGQRGRLPSNHDMGEERFTRRIGR